GGAPGWRGAAGPRAANGWGPSDRPVRFAHPATLNVPPAPLREHSMTLSAGSGGSNASVNAVSVALVTLPSAGEPPMTTTGLTVATIQRRATKGPTELSGRTPWTAKTKAPSLGTVRSTGLAHGAKAPSWTAHSRCAPAAAAGSVKSKTRCAVTTLVRAPSSGVVPWRKATVSGPTGASGG